jgi:hypothetical protein
MPSPRPSVTPSTHTVRVRILGGLYAPPDARQVWRGLDLTGDQTLADLGEAIPLAFGFDDPHLWSFFLSGKPWDSATEYARSPSADDGRPARAADQLHIRDAPTDSGRSGPGRLARSGGNDGVVVHPCDGERDRRSTTPECSSPPLAMGGSDDAVRAGGCDAGDRSGGSGDEGPQAGRDGLKVSVIGVGPGSWVVSGGGASPNRRWTGCSDARANSA